jgi:DNA-binding CsgD family transcriptional regulator
MPEFPRLASTDMTLRDLTALAASTTPRDHFRTIALDLLQREIGFDFGVLWRVGSEHPTDACVLGFSPDFFRRYSAGVDRYGPELAPLMERASSGPTLDTAFFSASARGRMAFYADIVRPVGSREFVTAIIRVASHIVGTLQLGRAQGASSRFGARHLETLAPLLPALALGEAVRDERSAAPRHGAANEGLSPREREIVDLIVLGYTNPEIATALGTSPNTVRNQLAKLYRKLGVSTRSEMLGVLLRPSIH